MNRLQASLKIKIYLMLLQKMSQTSKDKNKPQFSKRQDTTNVPRTEM
jgi:hypothetical protein